jgi:hypothetical protein
VENSSARSLSPEGSLKQKRTKNIIKRPSEPFIADSVPKDRIKRSNETLEQLAEQLKGVFLKPKLVGEAFRLLFRSARLNLEVPKQEDLFLLLALSEAYLRAEKVIHDERSH